VIDAEDADYPIQYGSGRDASHATCTVEGAWEPTPIPVASTAPRGTSLDYKTGEKGLIPGPEILLSASPRRLDARRSTFHSYLLHPLNAAFASGSVAIRDDARRCIRYGFGA
jgi:hypothetical protein